jgi:hypothetical protein
VFPNHNSDSKTTPEPMEMLKNADFATRKNTVSSENQPGNPAPNLLSFAILSFIFGQNKSLFFRKP